MATAEMTVVTETVVAAPVATGYVNDLWERLALSDEGAIVTNGNDRQTIRYIYSDIYRIKFEKDKAGNEKAHQWGRVWFFRREDELEDGEMVFDSPRKYRPATVHVSERAGKAAA